MFYFGVEMVATARSNAGSRTLDTWESRTCGKGLFANEFHGVQHDFARVFIRMAREYFSTLRFTGIRYIVPVILEVSSFYFSCNYMILLLRIPTHLGAGGSAQ